MWEIKKLLWPENSPNLNVIKLAVRSEALTDHVI